MKSKAIDIIAGRKVSLKSRALLGIWMLFAGFCVAANAVDLPSDFRSIPNSSGATFDRAAAIQRVEQEFARLAQFKVSAKEQEQEFSRRRKAGENIADEYTAALMKRVESRPNFTAVYDDAIAIVVSDPNDNAAFRAINAVLSCPLSSRRERDDRDQVRRAGQAQALMQKALLGHLQRPDFLGIFDFSGGVAHLHFEDWRQATEFWDRVYKVHPDGSVARELLKSNFFRLNEPGTSDEERDACRANVKRYAALSASDDSQGAAQALKALGSSAGSRVSRIDALTVEGKNDAIGNYRGKVVLLDIWAVWCGPCRKSHPGLVALKEKMTGRLFEIVGVSVDAKRETVIQYMTKTQRLPWVNWHVGEQSSMAEQLSVDRYPTYILLDVDGIIQARIHAVDDKVLTLIDELVAKAEASGKRQTSNAVPVAARVAGGQN